MKYDDRPLLRILWVVQIPIVSGTSAHNCHVIFVNRNNVEILRIQRLQFFMTEHRQPLSGEPCLQRFLHDRSHLCCLHSGEILLSNRIRKFQVHSFVTAPFLYRKSIQYLNNRFLGQITSMLPECRSSLRLKLQSLPVYKFPYSLLLFF